MKSTWAPILLMLLGACATSPPETRLPWPKAAGHQSITFTENTPPHIRDLLLRAMALIGTPYRFGGSSPDTGFDCSGFVRYVFQSSGLVLPRTSDEMSQTGSQIGKDELQPGDLVFFDTLRRPFSHVGIYLGEHRFIHAPSNGGYVEIVNLTDRYWRKRYNGARRIGL